MHVVTGLVALAAGCLLGWLGRYVVIEGERVSDLCTRLPMPSGCEARTLLIVATFSGAWGIVAVATAAVAWATRRQVAAFFATLALFAGGLALNLYDATWAASGVLAALLRLPRTGADEPPDPREFSA